MIARQQTFDAIGSEKVVAILWTEFREGRWQWRYTFTPVGYSPGESWIGDAGKLLAFSNACAWAAREIRRYGPLTHEKVQQHGTSRTTGAPSVARDAIVQDIAKATDEEVAAEPDPNEARWLVFAIDDGAAFDEKLRTREEAADLAWNLNAAGSRRRWEISLAPEVQS